METKTIINFLGYGSVLRLTLEIDHEVMSIICKNINSSEVHTCFGDSKYIGVKIVGRDGAIKFDQSIKGNESAVELANNLNGFKYENGDYINFYHPESYERMNMVGVENVPYSLETGCKNLEVYWSYFYFLNGKLMYSDLIMENLGSTGDKSQLILLIEDLIRLSPLKYTTDSYLKFKEALYRGRNLIHNSIVTEEEVSYITEEINKAKENLKEKNIIKFKNSVENLCLELSFEDSKIIATGLNEDKVAPLKGDRTYIGIEIYDRKGIIKLNGSITGNENPLRLINLLNGFRYEKGDYFKFYHEDKMIQITGFVKDSTVDMDQEIPTLDLNNSFFYIEDNLRYAKEQLNISADTKVLKKLLEEIQTGKEGLSYNYTSKSYASLNNALKYSENLLTEFSISEKEVLEAIGSLERGRKELKDRNKIIFKGYNNKVILSLRMDFTNMVIVAGDSIARAINDYYPTTEYISVKLFNRNGVEKYSRSLYGTENTVTLANELNGFPINKGDYLKFYHAEPKKRLVITDSIENAPFDLTDGMRELDLANSYFFLMDEKEELRYSDKILDTKDYKEILSEEIKSIPQFNSKEYEKKSYEELQRQITKANEVINNNNNNETIDGIVNILKTLRDTIKGLKRKSKVIFKGKNDMDILTLEIDEVSNKFIATGSEAIGEHSLKNKKYIEVMLYDENSIEKASYSIGENDNTLILAKKLNEMSYESGDYLKFYHLESDIKFKIEGYVENAPFALDRPSYKLDLLNSKFIIDAGILNYLYTNQEA